MILIGLWLVAITAVSIVISRFERSTDETSWNGYLEATEGVPMMLGRAARQLSGVAAVQRAAHQSPQFRIIERRLRLGGAFSGSMEIFFSVQLLTIIVALGSLSTALLLPASGLIKIMFAGFGIVLAIWPFNEVNKKAVERGDRISDELPDFAELLVMVLPSMSVPQSLAFTAEHTKGIVSSEMRELVRTLSSRSMPEDEAFRLTAERLGTDDGRQFVDALRDAYLEGTRVVENIMSQAETMRRVSFQRQRAAAKKLPMKLTIMFALHFMPLLFALAFLPVVFALTGATN